MTVIYTGLASTKTELGIIFTGSAAWAESPSRVLDRLASEPHDLVVVAADIRIAVALELAESVRQARPAIGVILLRERSEPEIYREAMLAGVREVVASDDLREIASAAQRSRALTAKLVAGEPNQPPRQPAKTIAVFSAKGGCGKTTAATNLAALLAKDSSKVVCLVDLDLQFGDVAVALQLEPARTIADAQRALESGDPMDLSEIVTKASPNLHVLLAPANPIDAGVITAALVHEVIGQLRKSYDYVVIDTPPAITDAVICAFEAADSHLLLTTPDAPSVKNLKLAVGLLNDLKLPSSKRTVILNRAGAKSSFSTREIAKTLGVDVSWLIPESTDVVYSLNSGVPVVVLRPRSKVSVAFVKMAAGLGLL